MSLFDVTPVYVQPGGVTPSQPTGRSLFDVTPVYVQPGGVTPSQPTGALTPSYVQPDGTVIPSSQPESWWQRTFGGSAPAYVPAPPPPRDPRGCQDDGGGVILKGQGEATTSRRRAPRAATVTPSPFDTTPAGTTPTE